MTFCFSGPIINSEDPTSNGDIPPGRRLVVPLPICVFQGLSFVKARLLSMEIPAHVTENNPIPTFGESNSSEDVSGSEIKMDKLVKIDPFRGSWGLRFLELELSNPTDVVFEIRVSVQIENSLDGDNIATDQDAAEFCYPKTRIDRDYSARVLIPLEHFKLPVLDESFMLRDSQADGASRSGSFSEKNAKAELNASIEKLISRIKVKWHSGRNSSGELNIKDAIQKALQTSVMDVLLPDPLTFGFRLLKSDTGISDKVETPNSKSSVVVNEITTMEVMVRNNTKELIKMSLNVTCRDVAGENCVEGSDATVLWSGKMSILVRGKLSFVRFLFLSLFFKFILLILKICRKWSDVFSCGAFSDAINCFDEKGNLMHLLAHFPLLWGRDG